MPQTGTDGLQFFDLSHPWGHDAPLWPYFPDVTIKRFHYHAKSGVLSQQNHDLHALHHAHRRARARDRGHAVHGRGAAVELLRHRRGGLDPEGQVGRDHARRPGGRPARDPRRRHRDRQHRLAPPLRRQPQVLRRVARHLQGGRRLAARQGRQGLRDRLPGARPRARHGDRRPAERPAGAQRRRRVPRAHRGRGHRRLPDWEPCHRALLGNGIVGFENVGGEIFGADAVRTAMDRGDVSAIVAAQIGIGEEPLRDERGRPNMGRMAHICRDTSGGMVLRSRFWLGAGTGLPAEELRATIPNEIGLGLMRHATTEFKYLSRFLPSLYIADQRDVEPVELPW